MQFVKTWCVDSQVWDINEPGPEELAGKVNVVLASNAVHTCRDLATTLSHVHNLLADDGFFLFYEYTVCHLWSESCHWRRVHVFPCFPCLMNH